ncbi:DNA topoisomerase [Lactarius hatsudake]|nr:DNA topoisomerase [Lactarius hatsudake]
MKNKEIQNIKKMGLQHNKDYSDVGSLQYGQLMIMTDQRLSSQRCQWAWAPCVGNGVEDDRAQATFLEQPAFTRSQTPIVQVTKGKQRIDFFTILKYEQLPEQTPDAHKWNSKYYKGLRMSKDSDTHDYSHDRIYGSIWLDAMGSANSSISHLARKRRTIPIAYFDHNTDEISYSDFINKELRVSRWLRGRQDHASTRYIFTELAPIMRTIFHPPDDSLLNYLKEDNDDIEPERWWAKGKNLYFPGGAASRAQANTSTT